MVRLGFKPGAAGWQAQTKPRSYGGRPVTRQGKGRTLSSVYTRADYVAQNGRLFTEKNIFLFLKWPSLWRITPRNTLFVNSTLDDNVPQTDERFMISY